jgi:hypothetical protein
MEREREIERERERERGRERERERERERGSEALRRHKYNEVRVPCGRGAPWVGGLHFPPNASFFLHLILLASRTRTFVVIC